MTLLGEADNEKLGAAVTTSVTYTACTTLPDVAVTMTVPEPVVAVPAAVKVNVPGLSGLAGVDEAVTPAGKPLNDKPTGLLKPLIAVTVTVPLVLLP